MLEKSYYSYGAKDFIDVCRQDIIDEGCEIISENPNHDNGYEFVYKYKDIKDCLERHFDKSILLLDDGVLIYKNNISHNRECPKDIFCDYPEYKINHISFNRTRNIITILYSKSNDEIENYFDC